MNPLIRALRLSPVSALFLASALVLAQRPAPRIRGPIEASPSVPLAGSLNPHLRTADDLGPLAPDALIHGITLVFSRSAAQESDLQQLLAQQTDPSSALFHHWLTPSDFAARFGVAPTDVAATTAWLQSHGFTLDPAASPASGRITFSGTAAQVQQAFGAQLHHFRWQNQLHFAPASELSLPPALAPLTAAVLHLSDFRPKPNIRPHPDYTTRSTQAHFLSPWDIQGMYDLAPLLAANDAGFGQSIAIVGQSFVQTGSSSSINTFRTYFSGTISTITPVILPNSGVEAIFPGDVGESEIDLEYATSMASGANIFFVYSGSNQTYDVTDAIAFAITQDISPIISVSYSICEPLLSLTDLQQSNSLYEQASAQGQTIVAAGGDNGATACAAYGSQSGLSTAQQQQLAVSFPASSPYVTAVGGTQMAPGTFTAGTSPYWTSASNGDAMQSLVGYPPEVVWNEDSPTLGIFATGGGPSSVFARPSWQAGIPGLPSGSFRLLPDIALQASLANPGYLVCSDDPYIVGSQVDCDNSLQTNTDTYVLSGGTSFGAPIFAGFLADLLQYQHASGLGNVNPVLYSLAAQPAAYTSLFHDITTGTSNCISGDGNCGTAGQNNYAATTGYDLATGLGSVDFGKLAAAWPSSAPSSLIPTRIIFFGGYAAVDGSSQYVDAVVGIIPPASITPQPTGTMSFSLDGVAQTPVPLSSGLGDAGFNFAPPSTLGSHVLLARYSGDSAHHPSAATYSFVVGNVVPSGNFTLAVSNLSLSANGSGSTQVTITPSGGYTGALTWSISNITGGTVATSVCYLIDAPPINGPTTGTVHLGVGTACTSPTGLIAYTHVQRSAIERPSAPSRKLPPAAPVAALILCALLPARRHRRLLSLLSIAFIAALALSLSGCGGGGQSGGGGGGGGNPSPQVYTVNLNARDSVNGSIASNTLFTLTVN